MLFALCSCVVRPRFHSTISGGLALRFDFFNTPILQPGDDIGLIWFERFGEAAKDDDVKAQFLEPDDVTDLWGCTLSGASGEIEVDGFSSRGPLLAWLRYHGIPID